MQPVGAALPEFKLIGDNAIASPVIGQRQLVVLILLFDSFILAINSARDQSRLCGEAAAAIWLPLGRLLKYCHDSSAEIFSAARNFHLPFDHVHGK